MQRTLRLFGVLAILIAGSTSGLWGQVVTPNIGVVPGVDAYGLGGWGGFNFGGGYTGSTPAESFARGQADLLRAEGQAYESAARGAVSYEKARAQYMENQQRWHEIQLQRQRMGEQRRNEQYAAARATRERREATAQSTPQPQLNSSQYDRATGLVHWPALLQGADFDDSRRHLDDLLSWKAQTGESGGINPQIVGEIDQMIDALRLLVRSTDPTTYIESKRFLDLLRNEFI